MPFRLVPKQWTHGLRDNEFAQRILIDDFNDLSSGSNSAMITSIKNMLCLVDERIQCRLASRPWHEPAQALQMRSSPQIDSCCGHEISSKAYDSRFKVSLLFKPTSSRLIHRIISIIILLPLEDVLPRWNNQKLATKRWQPM